MRTEWRTLTTTPTCNMVLMPEIHGVVLAAGAAVAASLLVTARRRRQRDDASTCSKPPPMPSVEVPLRAETPRKALLGGDDELWEEQPNEHVKSTPPPRLAGDL